jgi:hypothetical protein
MEERYIIIPPTVNVFNAGYRWEVLDTETKKVICAACDQEVAELVVRALISRRQ